MSTSLSDSAVDVVAALLDERTGLVIGANRRKEFQSCITVAMHDVGESDPATYLSRLAAMPALMDELAGRVAVGETYFFRDPRQLGVIRDEIIPSLLRARPRAHRLRLWSAGCATGEEAYTLAIILRELGLADRATIIGTDISRGALVRARAGRYSKWSLRQSSETFRKQYFQRAGASFNLQSDVRSAVEFRYLNLADEFCPSPASGIGAMDLILCRNVFIYFSVATIKRVATRLLRALAPRGWLVLGASDPVLSELIPCKAVVTAAGLAYQQQAARAGAVARRHTSAAHEDSHQAHQAHRTAVAEFIARPAPGEDVPRTAGAVEDAADVHWTELHAEASGSEMAVRCYATRDYEGTIVAARRAVTNGGDTAELRALLVRALINSGKRAEAERACTAAISGHGMSAELHLLHAMLLNEVRQYQAAARAARRALFLDRGLVVAHLAHGAALAGLGHRLDARRAFNTAEKALAAMPADAMVPSSDGERAGLLGDLARVRLGSLGGESR